MSIETVSTRQFINTKLLGLLPPIALGLYLFVLSLSGFKEAWEIAFAVEKNANVLQNILNESLSSSLTSLLAGVVITSLVQSSSATIALVVATVASGALSFDQSVFLVMGANIGTTVTNTIVAIAHGSREEEFRRTLPAVIVDDLFKIMNVGLFFILENTTGILSFLSKKLIKIVTGNEATSGLMNFFPDIIDTVTLPVIHLFISWSSVFASKGYILALFTGGCFFALLLMSLKLLSHHLEKVFKEYSASKVQKRFEKPAHAFAIGFVLCWLLQSSSVSISILIPLVAQNAIKIIDIYHYSLGTALATTCDPGQIISYIKFGPIGLQTGLVHILMNLFGVIIFSFIPGLRSAPVWTAEAVGKAVGKNAKQGVAYLILYVVVLFFAVPMLLIYF